MAKHLAHHDLLENVFSRLDEWEKAGLFGGNGKLAVAISGGPDSMALGHIAWRWTRGKPYALHVLSVDHGLREDSAQEVADVGAYFTGLGVVHRILVWQHDGEAPQARLQEGARNARYALMAKEMRGAGLKALMVAHHRDDQAETFLFRLAKGSGLDGLAGMVFVQDFGEGLTLLRPFLDVSKAELVAYCDAHDIPYVLDPSNAQKRFARVRLRAGMEVLEREGLTAKRLAQTAARMARARNALEEMSVRFYKECLILEEIDCIVFNFNPLKTLPEEIVLRIVLQAIEKVGDAGGYGVRMEKAEALVHDLLKPEGFRKRTLGKAVFTRDDKDGVLIVAREGR